MRKARSRPILHSFGKMRGRTMVNPIVDEAVRILEINDVLGRVVGYIE